MSESRKGLLFLDAPHVTKGTTNNGVLFVVEGFAAFNLIRAMVLEDGYGDGEYGVASFQCHTDLRQALFAMDLSNYRELAIIPNPDFTGKKKMCHLILHIRSHRPELLQKLRFAIAPLFIRTSVRNPAIAVTGKDEYFSVEETRGEPITVGVDQSHKYVSGLAKLGRLKLSHVLESRFEIRNAKWEEMPSDIVGYALTSQFRMVRYDGPIPSITLQIFLDRVVVPAIIDDRSTKTPHAIDGLGVMVRKAVALIETLEHNGKVDVDHAAALLKLNWGHFSRNIFAGLTGHLDRTKDSEVPTFTITDGGLPAEGEYTSIQLSEKYKKTKPNHDFAIPHFMVGEKKCGPLHYVPVIPSVLVNGAIKTQIPSEVLKTDLITQLKNVGAPFPERHWIDVELIADEQIRIFQTYPTFMNYFFTSVGSCYRQKFGTNGLRAWFKDLKTMNFN